MDEEKKSRYRKAERKHKGLNSSLFKEISGKSILDLNNRVRKKEAEAKEIAKQKAFIKINGSLEIKLPKVIGITGGIGAGKSMLIKHLKSKKIPTYIADFHAKKIANSPEVISKMKQVWGRKILTNKKFDKKKLADIVFENKEQLAILNKIIHPLVKLDWDNWLYKKRKHPWVAKESAILLEVGGKQYCEIVICVIASLDARLERIMKRDKISKAAAQLRMNSQWNDEQRTALSDFIIQNNSIPFALSQLDEILEKIIV